MTKHRAAQPCDEGGGPPPDGRRSRGTKGCGLPAAALIAHMQAASEQQKMLLARELHDDLGGLLVGAAMDLAWAEQHIAAPPADLRQKLVRARQTLSSAIDLKRKMIETLRPTLLDNVGLLAALRWHVQTTAAAAEMTCSIDLPPHEMRFRPDVPIALFRIVQETLAVIVAHQQPASGAFSVTVGADALNISISSRAGAAGAAPAPFEPHALAAVRHRTAMLGGDFTFESSTAGTIAVRAHFSLAALTAG